MIRNTIETNTFENLHGGTGTVIINKKVTPNDHVRGLYLFAEVIIQPNSSIGYHHHKNDAEGYFIIEGKGVFINENEERIPVKPGDLCLITKGQSHGMENFNDNELKMIAVVY